MSSEDAVRQMFLEGQRKWPLVKLGFDVFFGHCSRVLPTSEPDAPREAADLYLCCACAQAQPEALRLFESEGSGVATAAIARIDRSADFVQDTLQEVWDRLLLGAEPKVKLYSGRGPLKAWVRVAATRVALDRQRARKRFAGHHIELTDCLAAPAGSPEAAMLKSRFGHAFHEALRDAVSGLSSQERNVLRMHVTGHCSIDEIGRAYNVHRATAARWLERTRARIYDEVRQELCVDRAHLTASEFKSLATAMGADLELSFSRSSERLAASGGLG
jgi:RNA polymerase sigma-70 factor (ECF subfamily)